MLVINVRSYKMTRAHAFFVHVFHALDASGLPAILACTSELQASIALDGRAVPARDLETLAAELGRYGRVRMVTGMAVFRLSGDDIGRCQGCLFKALGDSGVNIEMISQGPIEHAILWVVSGRDAEKTLATVKAQFCL
ncbi:uncharacterized protein PpBr36_10097 [Pyricularia pennisetigena]|uniref:uncharacterized protein n=1 Tax=Pyricularia pennisetigena TaxID=1578925 RepID=UPI001152C004|nr:uncharacterized protein PpBr36_10097 [Pyricularia pennisetigena]TLS22151.1 hypothetical protein PpBr36_10097 [Pyricularia pennisetigena]